MSPHSLPQPTSAATNENADGSVTCARVSIWQSPDDPVYAVQPAKLTIDDDYATLRVHDDQWPDAVDPDTDTVAGWQVLAHADGDDDTPLYEGEVATVETSHRMGVTRRKLHCEPAREYGPLAAIKAAGSFVP